MNYREELEAAAHTLASRREARILLEEATGMTFAELFAHLEEEVGEDVHARVATLVARRNSGEPLQFVLGHWPFRNLELLVDHRALVPRPETEVVVEVALAELDRVGGGRDSAPLLVLDLGTGSGAIACAIAAEAPRARVVAVDDSKDALGLALANRSRLPAEAAGRLVFVAGEWYEPIKTTGADLVVANPPYLSSEEWESLEPVVRDFDPKEALVAGPTGLEGIAAVIEGAPARLRPGGALVCEIAAHQGEAAHLLALRARAKSAEIGEDLAGRDRVLVARW